MTEEQKLLGLSVIIAAIIIGILVAVTLHHLMRDRRARAVNRTLNADPRPRDKP